jgi:hypothetical protein
MQVRFWHLVTLGLLLHLPAGAARADTGVGAPSWVAPMKQVHARFTGTPGTFAHFGDSITVTMAFWSPLAHADPKTMDRATARDLRLVKGYLRPECWDKWKGPEHGNNGSMTIRWAHENVDAWLKKHNPEVVLILFGTNDLGQLGLKEYRDKTADVVDRCLKNGSIVILTTLPPRAGQLAKCREFAEAVRRVGREKNVPVIDYFAEVLKRRPEDWNGALPKFQGTAGGEYEVPTLIAGDGVHPSNPKKYQGYTDEALAHNGYALRSYLTLRAYADVIRAVCR